MNRYTPPDPYEDLIDLPDVPDHHRRGGTAGVSAAALLRRAADWVEEDLAALLDDAHQQLDRLQPHPSTPTYQPTA
jgi:hypothetical protein